MRTDWRIGPQDAIGKHCPTIPWRRGAGWHAPCWPVKPRTHRSVWRFHELTGRVDYRRHRAFDSSACPGSAGPQPRRRPRSPSRSSPGDEPNPASRSRARPPRVTIRHPAPPARAEPPCHRPAGVRLHHHHRHRARASRNFKRRNRDRLRSSHFNAFRGRMNDIILNAGNLTINRFFALDHRCYDRARSAPRPRRCSGLVRAWCSALRRLHHLSRGPLSRGRHDPSRSSWRSSPWDWWWVAASSSRISAARGPAAPDRGGSFNPPRPLIRSRAASACGVRDTMSEDGD